MYIYIYIYIYIHSRHAEGLPAPVVGGAGPPVGVRVRVGRPIQYFGFVVTR